MSEFKVNKKNILGVDIILVEGPQGIGKTSFIASLLNQDYKYHHKYRTKQATAFSNDLNLKYGYNLKIDNRHLYFSNIPIYLTKDHTVKTWSCDFKKFAIPNDDFEVDYFPPYSVLFFTELDSQAFCRNWQQFSEWYIFLFKYFRHMHYTILIDLQVDGFLEKALRSLETLRLSVYEAYNKESLIFKRVKGRVTKFLYTNPQLLEFSRQLRKLEGSLSVGKVEKKKHIFKGNIFKQYNSFSGLPYFLYKINNWTFNEHKAADLSPDGIEKYRKDHPLGSPNKNEGTTKKTKSWVSFS